MAKHGIKSAVPAASENAGSPNDLSGQTFGEFRLLRQLGEGGMGQVYLAEQISLKRHVAVKLLRADLANNEVSRKRFEAEAKAVAQLTHANIVQVYAVGEVQKQPFMALEYVEGWTLKDYLNRKGPPDLPIALSLMRQVAAALVKAAEVGIIHRDIKPENILLTRKAEVKVTDFGLSRVVRGDQQALNLTQTGMTMGTPLYMSPEQVMGQPLDHRTDIYSFGATCYHLLTGQPPFSADTAVAVGLKHVQEEPLPLEHLRPDLPPALSALVLKMMAKRPEDRHQSAREILRDLKRLSEAPSEPEKLLALDLRSSPGGLAPGALVTSEAPPSAERITIASMVKPARAKGPSWPVILGGSLVAAILAGGAFGLWYRHQAFPVVPTEGTKPGNTSAPKPGPARLDESAKRREAMLLEAIQRPPGGLRRDQEFRRGIHDRIELAYFYLVELPQPFTERCRAFFVEELEGKPGAQPEFRSINSLLLAMTRAFAGELDTAQNQLTAWYEDFARGEFGPNLPRLPNEKRPGLGQMTAAQRMNFLVETNRKLADLWIEALDRIKSKHGSLEKPLQKVHADMLRLRGTPKEPAKREGGD
jgi:serine/threonine protein kinase